MAEKNNSKQHETTAREDFSYIPQYVCKWCGGLVEQRCLLCNPPIHQKVCTQCRRVAESIRPKLKTIEV